MMLALLKAALLVAPLVSANVALDRRATCNADNCARAVSGTVTGKMPSLSSRLADCNGFLAVTVTPVTTSVLTVFTGTTTTTVSTAVETNVVSVTTTTTAAPQFAKRQASIGTVRGSATSVPTYASACSGTVRYSSACSCFSGVAATTLTAPTSTTVITVLTLSTVSTTTSTTTTTTTTATATVTPTARACNSEQNSVKSTCNCGIDTSTGQVIYHSTGDCDVKCTVDSECAGIRNVDNRAKKCVFDDGGRICGGSGQPFCVHQDPSCPSPQQRVRRELQGADARARYGLPPISS